MTVTPDTPLRLAQAAELAFPGGGIKVSGLRKERDAGRLKTWRVANKEFTTLAEIAAMIELCKQAVPARARPAPVSAIDTAQQAEIALAAALARCETPRGAATGAKLR